MIIIKTDLYKVTWKSFHILWYWAIPFKIHTPPVEDFECNINSSRLFMREFQLDFEIEYHSSWKPVEDFECNINSSCLNEWIPAEYLWKILNVTSIPVAWMSEFQLDTRGRFWNLMSFQLDTRGRFWNLM